MVSDFFQVGPKIFPEGIAPHAPPWLRAFDMVKVVARRHLGVLPIFFVNDS
jgi:hypothetical protein